ncbi:hypothetical protein S40285_10287 [Stachybotrys chlorohalonatus IBT 40285]|uniref:Uncharacterized protein n=1 Tax=Stachybotrys chlorohalonatus (strain IBT 40285) TaxID=1283841 RepID=A0A084QTA3_STAC4|nr:hypothetical protein S40285_10287 [Stachybotrys chlorohalonata IBT 40285]
MHIRVPRKPPPVPPILVLPHHQQHLAALEEGHIVPLTHEPRRQPHVPPPGAYQRPVHPQHPRLLLAVPQHPKSHPRPLVPDLARCSYPCCDLLTTMSPARHGPRRTVYVETEVVGTELDSRRPVRNPRRQVTGRSFIVSSPRETQYIQVPLQSNTINHGLRIHIYNVHIIIRPQPQTLCPADPLPGRIGGCPAGPAGAAYAAASCPAAQSRPAALGSQAEVGRAPNANVLSPRMVFDATDDQLILRVSPAVAECLVLCWVPDICFFDAAADSLMLRTRKYSEKADRLRPKSPVRMRWGFCTIH